MVGEGERLAFDDDATWGRALDGQVKSTVAAGWANAASVGPAAEV
jgi:hypothetical protein